MTERKPRFQFSVRLMLLMMAVFSASVILFLNFRRVQIPVPTQMETDSTYHSHMPFIYETRNPFTASAIRENHAASEEEKRILAEADPEERFRIYQEQAEQQRQQDLADYLLKAPEEAEFWNAYELAESGDSSGFLKLVDRHSTDRQSDQAKLLKFALNFPPKMVCKSEVLVTLLKDTIKQNGLPSLEESRVLHNGEHDSQPRIDGLKYQIENSTDYEKTSALEQLLEVAPTEDTFRLALKIFEDPKNMANRELYCHYLIETLFAIESFADAAGGEFKNRLVAAAIRYVEEDKSSEDRYFAAVLSVNSPEFVDLFRQTVAKPKYKSRRNGALYMLEKHGEKGEASQALDSILANEIFPSDVMNYFQHRDGKEAVFHELAKRLATNKSHPMLVAMCERAEEDNRDKAKSICESVIEELFDKDSPYFEKYGVIDYLDEFGFEQVDELRKRVPVVKGVWRLGHQAPNEFIEWVNNNLDPIHQVDPKTAFGPDGMWQPDEEGNHHPGSFRIQVMEAAGRAVFLDPQEHGFDSYFFAKIASAGGEQFQIEAHDVVDSSIRLLVNGVSYTFEFDDSEAWFDVVNSCEMMNTILKRHKFKERFFVFSEPAGNSYMLYALFAKPKVAKELADKYGNPFVKGCELYWK